MSEESYIKELMKQYPYEGVVSWIGLRPARKGIMISVDSAEVKIGKGLVGDRYNGKADSKRQVTLIQKEHVNAVFSILRLSNVDYSLLRRNIVIEGINLLSLKEVSFEIGEAIFSMSGLCHPCSRMEENLGIGGYNAMRGHGGITAKVLKEGIIKVGDKVKVIEIC